LVNKVATVEVRRVRAEFGDFQTPSALAEECCTLLRKRGTEAAAIKSFSTAKWGIGLEINPLYAESARSKIKNGQNFTVFCRSFFDFDWKDLLGALPDPLLVIGNPPWVTNSLLGDLKSGNIPFKENFDEMSGLDALTGKSNFDISEWMLISICDWLNGRKGTLAMLCKAAVARKLFQRIARARQQVRSCGIYFADAPKHFGASVEACFLVIEFEPGTTCNRAAVYESMVASTPSRTLAYEGDLLVGDADAYERVKHLSGVCGYRWRSGLKHDCAAVMEIYQEGGGYRNGLGETFDLEDTFLYPILKSSEVASGACIPSRQVLVTQQTVGEPTDQIRSLAPKTWDYLQAHSKLLGDRQSRIYKGKPEFSIFGIGPYSFSPWKIAISGLYKKLVFSLVAPSRGKSIMLDDTVYFLSFSTKTEAESVLTLLASDLAREFLNTQIFWDAKRPITLDILSRLNIDRLAADLGSVIERPPRISIQSPDEAPPPLFA
jgi:hypothetical protein